MKLKELKRGEYFTKKSIEFPNEKQVFVRGEYDRELKKYECYRFSDINDYVYISGSKEVFTEFVF